MFQAQRLDKLKIWTTNFNGTEVVFMQLIQKFWSIKVNGKLNGHIFYVEMACKLLLFQAVIIIRYFLYFFVFVEKVQRPQAMPILPGPLGFSSIKPFMLQRCCHTPPISGRPDESHLSSVTLSAICITYIRAPFDFVKVQVPPIHPPNLLCET